MSKITAVLAIAAVLTLGGCGGSGKDDKAAGGSDAPTTGCTETKSEELYVKQMYSCADRNPATRVYIFDSTTARDNYWTAAESMGAAKVGEGALWLETKA